MFDFKLGNKTRSTQLVHELIVDNGRGTINNQDTERSDTATVTPN